VPWLKRLVSGLSSRCPGFAPGTIHAGFVVDKVALGQVSPRYSIFHLSISFHRRSPYSWTTCLLVAAVQRRSLTPSKSTIYNLLRRAFCNKNLSQFKSGKSRETTIYELFSWNLSSHWVEQFALYYSISYRWREYTTGCVVHTIRSRVLSAPWVALCIIFLWTLRGQDLCTLMKYKALTH
jgi:hypothetical protein